METCWVLHPDSAPKTSGQGKHVGVFQVPSNGKTRGQAADFYWAGACRLGIKLFLQELLNVQGGGVPFYGWVSSEDHFSYPLVPDALRDLCYGEIPGAYSFQGGNEPAKHMKESVEFP